MGEQKVKNREEGATWAMGNGFVTAFFFFFNIFYRQFSCRLELVFSPERPKLAGMVRNFARDGTRGLSVPVCIPV